MLRRDRASHFQPSAESHHRLLSGRMQAASDCDLRRLTDVLSEDVVLSADGGGKVAARRYVRFTARTRVDR